MISEEWDDARAQLLAAGGWTFVRRFRRHTSFFITVWQQCVNGTSGTMVLFFGLIDCGRCLPSGTCYVFEQTSEPNGSTSFIHPLCWWSKAWRGTPAASLVVFQNSKFLSPNLEVQAFRSKKIQGSPIRFHTFSWNTWYSPIALDAALLCGTSQTLLVPWKTMHCCLGLIINISILSVKYLELWAKDIVLEQDTKVMPSTYHLIWTHSKFRV